MSSDAERTSRALFAQALRLHGAALRAFVRSRVRESEADDVLQLATMRAAQHIANLEDPDKVRAWLFRITRNTIVDAKRSAVSRARVESTGDIPDLEAPTSEMSCRCSVKLAETLPHPQSRILSLVDLGDASLAEAAATLEISVNNATVRLHRAREALRKRLREHCGVSAAGECKDCRCVYDGCCAS